MQAALVKWPLSSLVRYRMYSQPLVRSLTAKRKIDLSASNQRHGFSQLNAGAGAIENPMDEPGDRRIVKTGRTVEEINAAARLGYRPLVKSVLPGSDIRERVAVFQDRSTGEISVCGDLRYGDSYGEMVLGYTSYYPYHFPNPFAAYLVPPDIAPGEEVWLDDLIEDVVAEWGGQGQNTRLEASPAIWNGSDFDIQFDPQRDADHWIG